MNTTAQTAHACHKDQLSRMNRIAGQIGGICKMIEDERYCMDILIQMKAVRAALKKVESNILRKHMQQCVTQALGESAEAQKKVAELMKAFDAEGN